MTKKEFVEGPLAEVIRNAKMDVQELVLSRDEKEVLIVFKGDHIVPVNIDADSFGAIILDVTRKAMY